MESIHVASRILKSFDVYLYSSFPLSTFFFFFLRLRILTSFTSILISRISQNFTEIPTGYREEKFFLPYQRNICKFFHTSATKVIPRICARKMRRARPNFGSLSHEVRLFFRGRASPRLASRTNRARVLVPVRPPRNTACHLPTLA